MIAFTREVSDSITRCELTHLRREPIDLAKARDQHHAFEDVLRKLGCEVRRLPDAHDLPDAVFVQDAALVFDEVAVLCRTGAESRRAEVEAFLEPLGQFRRILRITEPATLDGGDVVVLGKRVFVGLSRRTNQQGFEQLSAILQPFGYRTSAVAVNGCLHLQTAITPIADHTILVNREWIDSAIFGDVKVIDIDPSEPFAANALRVGDAVVHPLAFSKTRARLEAQGLRVVPVDASELAKAEAGVTCCCIVVPSP